jgi:hypothetical protein
VQRSLGDRTTTKQHHVVVWIRGEEAALVRLALSRRRDKPLIRRARKFRHKTFSPPHPNQGMYFKTNPSIGYGNKANRCSNKN